jgi:serine/threonine protein kinase
LQGATIGNFRVLEKLGVGGMGLVYEAEDTRLGRKVALKFLPATIEATPETLARFEREARAASTLNHPNICTIYGVFDHLGRPVIEMERLEGRTLRERVGRPLDATEVVSLAMQVADGLDAAHARGIIHRDLTPGNIFCTLRGTAKILDFGIAKVESEPDAGPVAGTAGYMSPEQVSGDAIDLRSDVFSLGAVMYEMATGRSAFPGESARSIRDAILTQEPIPPRRWNHAIPVALERIILKALRKDRDLRYQRMCDIRRDLDRLQRSAVHRLQRILIAAASLAIVLAAGVVWYLARSRLDTPEVGLRLRQITHNSSENNVTSGAISPDGRREAYTDANGIHLRVIETGDTVDIPESGTPPRGTTWDVSPGWFPQAARFVANSIATDNSDDSSVWVVDLSGGLQKIHDHGEALAVSPNGFSIAVGTNRIEDGYRHVWLLDIRTESVGPLFRVDAGTFITGLSWSPDGRRVAYLRMDSPGQHSAIETRDLTGGSASTIVQVTEPDELMGVVWLRDRLIYSQMRRTIGPTAGAQQCSYWQQRVDARTGLPIGSSKPFASWLPQCARSVSVTADGKGLSYVLSSVQDAIYVADLDADRLRVASSRRLTLTEGRNIPSGWTPDNRSIVFVSDTLGHAALVRQPIGADTPQPIVVDARIMGAARLTPDGDAVLYRLAVERRDPMVPSRLMRVPTAGGVSRAVGTGIFVDGGARCTVLPANLCAIAERSADGRQLVFTSIDAFKGRDHELARMDITSEGDYRWALSPDGTRIAVLNAKDNWIRVLSLTGLSPHVFEVQGQDALGYVSWTTDGRQLIVPRVDARDATLLVSNLQGKTTALWHQRGAVDISGIPSPDGSRIAVWVRSHSANLSLAEYR